MKKTILILISILTLNVISAQEESFKDGEWFKFKMSYSGWMKAGNATLS